MTENSNVVQLNWKSFHVVRHLILPEYKIDNIDTEDCIKQYEIGEQINIDIDINILMMINILSIQKYFRFIFMSDGKDVPDKERWQFFSQTLHSIVSNCDHDFHWLLVAHFSVPS